MPEVLESKFNSISNAVFYEISERIRAEVGIPESKRVFSLWQDWLEREARRLRDAGKAANIQRLEKMLWGLRCLSPDEGLRKEELVNI